MSSNRSRGRDSGHKRKHTTRDQPDQRHNRSRPRHPDKEVDRRIRELDAERDPLSLPEEIVSEANKSGQRVGIPKEGDKNESLTINDLQQSSLEASAVDGC